MSEPRKLIKYDIPPGASISKCSGCDADIVWIKTAAGKSMPVDGDGTPHWATCPNAKDFKKKAKP